MIVLLYAYMVIGLGFGLALLFMDCLDHAGELLIAIFLWPYILGKVALCMLLK